MKQFYFLLLATGVLLVTSSCSKDDLQNNPSDFPTPTKGVAENPDSVLLNYVSLKDMCYTLNLSVTDAERLGVTKEKYNETLERIAGLNEYIQERIDSGDVMQCLPPPMQETKALKKYDVDLHALLGQYQIIPKPSNYFYLMAPKTICGFITGSNSLYYAVTIHLQGATKANYTITCTQSTPSTSVHMTHPGNGLPLPPGEEMFSDCYNTHDWTFETSIYGYTLPNFGVMLTLHRRGNY